jgi:PPK2 family polyphosphate:nucleotide phosphotransferase
MAKKDKRIETFIENRLLVEPGKKFSLKKRETKLELPGFDKARAQKVLAEGVEKLAKYQDMLYAQDVYSLLIVFQAMDAAGKDGTIKHVMSGLNPQGCEVYSFKAPSSEELDHDYLWRCTKVAPRRGNIGIFNRSYYEEVLITRVHPEILDRQKLPLALKKDKKKLIERRYEEINNFEKYLTAQGTVILKFFLNVSKKEQKARFLSRIEDESKNWKFSATDAKERGHWDAYMQAYEQCLEATSTKHAPWFVVPADDKPMMRLAVAAVIYDTMRKLDLAYPEVGPEQKRQLAEAKKVLEAE